MSALIEFDGVRATTCTVAAEHRPKPARYVWHHILPQVCGGVTATPNLAEVCDNCHYSVHALLYQMRVTGGAVPKTGTVGQRALALAGYRLAVLAGTVNRIPNEGSASFGGHE